jgi:nicotinamidase-related amidase
MFSPRSAVLVVIDIQGALAGLMREKDTLFKNAARLIQAARLFDMPVVFTEQVPEKIGPTVPEIARLWGDGRPIIKRSFSCCGEAAFVKKLEELDRDEVIVAGIETHVCVYQTVCDLVGRGYAVQVVADAVSSRGEFNRRSALERMRSLDVGVTNTEMVICELLKTSEHPKFREIIRLIK